MPREYSLCSDVMEGEVVLKCTSRRKIELISDDGPDTCVNSDMGYTVSVIDDNSLKFEFYNFDDSIGHASNKLFVSYKVNDKTKEWIRVGHHVYGEDCIYFR